MENFNVLPWCSINGGSKEIANDILAILIFTIDSEFTFSVGGKIMTKCSKLNKDILEVLMCTRVWLWNEIGDKYINF